MKRVLSIICAVAMLCATTHCYAEERTYQSHEVAEMVENAFATHGIETSFVQVEQNRVYTQQEVDEKLTEIENDIENKDVVPFPHLAIGAKLDNLGFFRGNIVAPNYMEARRYFCYQKYLANDTQSGGTIAVEMYANVNLGSNTFVSVESLSSRAYGYNLNFVSWEQTSATYSFSSDMRTVYVTIKGTMNTSVKYSGTIVVGLVQDHTITTSANL